MIKRAVFYILLACASVFLLFGGYMANKVTARNISSPTKTYYIKYNARGGDVYISNVENIIIIADGALMALSIGGIFIFIFISRKSK